MPGVMSLETIHLRPNEPVAERVLLPGDPGRALRLAQQLTEAPRMLNHNRGLWGYTGVAADGEPLTIQSTGMGGPSAAIVIEELIALGARRLIRVGTCGALQPHLRLGELIAATTALGADGASRALGASDPLPGDPELLAGLAADHTGEIVSSDLFYDPDPARAEAWTRRGCLAIEMEAATLYALARLRGVRAACVLAVSDLVATRERIADEALQAAEAALGRAALAALAAP
jgi:DeoD family purine-nucleoside phosphorylase